MDSTWLAKIQLPVCCWKVIQMVAGYLACGCEKSTAMQSRANTITELHLL